MPCLVEPGRFFRKGFGGGAEVGAELGTEEEAAEGVERPDCELASCGERSELMSIIKTVAGLAGKDQGTQMPKLIFEEVQAPAGKVLT